MDMVLYALLKKEMEETPKDKVDNVGGYEIRFVNSIPSLRESNTIYFVMGEGKDTDKIVIGKQGVSHIIFENTVLDYAVLNNSVFLDRYDDNRHIHRELFDVTTEPIVCEDSAPYDLHIFTIKGNGVGDVMSITFGNEMVQVGKTMIGVYDGVTDELDMLSGIFTQRMATTTINEKITWQNIGVTSDGYREYKAIGYTGSKPLILKTNGSFDTNNFKPITKENSFITDSTFVTTVTGDVGKECVYYNNGSLFLRIDSSKVSTGSGTTYTSSLQTYLKYNPITIHLSLANEVVEQLLEPKNYVALDGTTEIDINYYNDCPRTIVEFPVRN